MNDLLTNALSFDPYEYLDAIKTLFIAQVVLLALILFGGFLAYTGLEHYLKEIHKFLDEIKNRENK